MNPSSNLLYKNVFLTPRIEGSPFSDIIMSADFSNIQFTLFVGTYTDLTTVVGTFEVGEVVTGGTSLATGVVVSVTETTMIIGSVSGTFTDTETITGETSGATADLDTPTTPDFTVNAYKSNQKSYNGVMNPPDVTLPAGPTNDYEQIMYTGEPGGVNYAVGFEYNPDNSGSPVMTPTSFVFQTQGAIWVFLQVIMDEMAPAGALVAADINLFNH